MPAVREAAERNREEQREERERSRDEPDLARAGAEREQPVGRDGTRDVYGGLRRRQREQRVDEPAAQSTTEQASGGMCTRICSPGTRCELWTVSGIVPASSSYS